MDEESVIRLSNAIMRTGRRLRTTAADEGLTATQSGVLATLVRQGPDARRRPRGGRGGQPHDALARAGPPRGGGAGRARARPRRRPLHAPSRATRRRAAGCIAPPARPPGRTSWSSASGELPAHQVDALLDALPALEALARDGRGPPDEPPGSDDTFAALRVPNYRRYFVGQAVSLVGTWMQTVAQGWLVLELTGSGTALGLVAAAQFLPILLLAPLRRRARRPARQAAPPDRHPVGARDDGAGPRAAGGDRPGRSSGWSCVLALAARADHRDRQPRAPGVRPGDGRAPARLRNAVSLNSVLVNTARAVGPGDGGHPDRHRRAPASAS